LIVTGSCSISLVSWAIGGGIVALKKSVCRFLGLEFRNELIEHIAPRAPNGTRPLDIDPRVRVLCTQLQDRLDEALRLQSEGRAA